MDNIEAPSSAMPDVVDQVALARSGMASRCSPCPPTCTSRPTRWRFSRSLEGPLDLLLYLIRKQNFNILDIPMARAHAPVPGVRGRNPQPQPGTGGRIPADGGHAHRDQVAHAAAAAKSRQAPEEAEDPRAELVRRLLEYEQMKMAASNWASCRSTGATSSRHRCISSKACSRVFPTHLVDLQDAWRDILNVPSWCSTTRSRARN